MHIPNACPFMHKPGSAQGRFARYWAARDLPGGVRGRPVHGPRIFSVCHPPVIPRWDVCPSTLRGSGHCGTQCSWDRVDRGVVCLSCPRSSCAGKGEGEVGSDRMAGVRRAEGTGGTGDFRVDVCLDLCRPHHNCRRQGYGQEREYGIPNVGRVGPLTARYSVHGPDRHCCPPPFGRDLGGCWASSFANIWENDTLWNGGRVRNRHACCCSRHDHFRRGSTIHLHPRCILCRHRLLGHSRSACWLGAQYSQHRAVASQGLPCLHSRIHNSLANLDLEGGCARWIFRRSCRAFWKGPGWRHGFAPVSWGGGGAIEGCSVASDWHSNVRSWAHWNFCAHPNLCPWSIGAD
mmetsp:Transcript_23473/g.59336  ORF Transcript_23473/g.59336 Transcript_23473/m.59336 type:complete len:348 (+) Transcript_23473:2-1045(+)